MDLTLEDSQERGRCGRGNANFFITSQISFVDSGTDIKCNYYSNVDERDALSPINSFINAFTVRCIIKLLIKYVGNIASQVNNSSHYTCTLLRGSVKKRRLMSLNYLRSASAV